MLCFLSWSFRDQTLKQPWMWLFLHRGLICINIKPCPLLLTQNYAQGFLCEMNRLRCLHLNYSNSMKNPQCLCGCVTCQRQKHHCWQIFWLVYVIIPYIKKKNNFYLGIYSPSVPQELQERLKGSHKTRELLRGKLKAGEDFGVTRRPRRACRPVPDEPRWILSRHTFSFGRTKADEEEVGGRRKPKIFQLVEDGAVSLEHNTQDCKLMMTRI